MSISDMIVVMKLGVVQQIGKPQDVYDNPSNLFVAKFLGTPPINVFDGKVQGGKLYIGEDAVLDVNLEDRDVFVGIRPEGFVPNDKGEFNCKLNNVEVMGRDVSIVSTNAASINPVIRSIVSSDCVKQLVDGQETISYSLVPHKTFIFDKETEERIYF
jgi:multiple sugar transport system ATP-binding protein